VAAGLALAQALALVAGTAVLVFVLVRLVPGDVVDVFGLQGGITAEMEAELRRQLGLDQGIPLQFIDWIGALLTGDFGTSLRFQRPIADMLAVALPATLELSFWAFAIGMGLGIGVAVAALVWPQSAWPAIVDALNIWSIAVPTFCVGLLLILVFVIWLDLMPLHSNMLLPALIIGIDIAGQIAKPLHEDLKETSTALFVRTAQAKGLHHAAIVVRHILPNSLTVLLALSGLILAGLVGGTLTMEVLFGLPGVGKLALDGMLGRDYPVVQTTVVLIAVAVVLANLVTELAARLIDPRVGDPRLGR
jgi:peptide/nickel transport system permease protein